MSHDGHRARLRQTLERSGLRQGFVHPYQKLELLLTYAIPRRDTKPLAKLLLQHFGSLSGVLFAPLEALQKVDGLGPKAAHFLRMIGELHLTLDEEHLAASRESLLQVDRVKAFLQRELAWQESEYVAAIFLDSKGRLIRHRILFRGTLNQSAVFPREVAKEALQHNAAAVIIAHNHPSQDPTPSQADLHCTRDVMAALNTLDISLHDHFIVAANGITSLRDVCPDLWHD